ncbi:hypothetical protein SCB49_01994 [unidentified eubacterium SCB49]|nr:hypothetical protein SCB49_01994 [unidentified eubacterium SCB49]
MQYKAHTIDAYIDQLPEERQVVLHKLRKIANDKLPNGFQETLNYNMPAWVVPHSAYPDGYHCDPKLPLPFLSIASQKNFIAIYHMGIYSDPKVLDWFTTAYPKHVKTKLDMGKSCIRFKKMETIPYELLGELFSKITVEDWITTYKNTLKK